MLLGRWLVTPGIEDHLIRFAAGIGIGLLAGILIGSLLSKALGRIRRHLALDGL